MGQNKQRPECVLGFYQTVSQPNGDLSGGVLLTSHLGRPIEFQCSLPVRPNPTQQILYGSSLRPFLVGELVAGALRDKLECKPDLLLVDDVDALQPATWGDIPLFSFKPPAGNAISLQCHQQTFWALASQRGIAEAFVKKLQEFVPDSADLKEPLIRVELALKEAMGIAA